MDAASTRSAAPWLLLMKGPPGSGKSTLARELGRRLGWPVIDKDDVRDLLPDAPGGLSYEAMLAIARRQLQLGLSVIADSPLSYAQSYRKAIAIASEYGAEVLVVECVCADEAVWRQRIESRAGMDLPAHHTTDWVRVKAFFARTASDTYTIDVPHVVVETTASDVGSAADGVLRHLKNARIPE